MEFLDFVFFVLLVINLFIDDYFDDIENAPEIEREVYIAETVVGFIYLFLSLYNLGKHCKVKLVF